ncbi:DUF559 domain-containing protein [Nocardioides sp.]|uniref:DUF559 domain-containing protein n=1 Tax=Nocardioides sp. TaxID=35761 RepID=UPI001A27FA8F|nr:DUF559 domain-containing protein [Nocardioides sp.]MBJ7356246.1 DUF559 domain-containing protein [Nocardioides sp.]
MDKDSHEPDPWAVVRDLAAAQSDVVSLRQLYAAGLIRWQVAAQLKAKRWQRLGDQSVCLHNGPVTDTQHQWAAVFQGGPRAKLDGAAALVAGGLERYTVDRLRVSVPRGAQARRTPRYDVRQTRRWDPDDRAPSGVPRARPAPAAVRGALWAVSDRQAIYLLTLTVQQGMATAEEIGAEALTVKRHARRLLVQEVVGELLDGARSLGEIDVARQLRRRGLPPPTRQAVRKDSRCRYYLDLYWPEWRLVVEIDGIHHAWVDNVVADALRQNSLAIAGDTVLRLPLLGLRLQPDDFFEQVEEALRANGWTAAA